jgi:hypothetical protein
MQPYINRIRHTPLFSGILMLAFLSNYKGMDT